MLPKQIVFVGFGAAARCLFALIPVKEPSWLGLPIVIIDPRKDLKEEPLLKDTPYTNQITILNDSVDKETIKRLFDDYVLEGAVVIDLSYRVDTTAMIRQCDIKHCIYVNTAIDYWEEPEEDWEAEDIEEWTLAYIREEIGRECKDCKTTAILNHGMNPGLVSHFVKHAIRKLYTEKHGDDGTPLNHMAMKLGLTTVHISERDTQKTCLQVTENRLLNTWSVKGLRDEGVDPVQVSWGTHEQHYPEDWLDKKHVNKYGQAFFPIRGMQMKLKSYEPVGGMLIGSCIPHSESASLANLINHDKYRISVYYVYSIPDVAKASVHHMESLNDDFDYYVLRAKDIGDGGIDSVGCLLFLGDNKKVWIGAVQPIDRIKKFNPEVNGTCMQVAISVLASLVWALNGNSERGICDPEDLDTDFILNYCDYWMGDFVMKDVSEDTRELSDQFYDLLVCPKSDSIIWKKKKV